MDNGLRRYTAEEIQAALGDRPFVVRGLWPGEPSAGAPSAPVSPVGTPPPESSAEPVRAEPRRLTEVSEPDVAADAEPLHGARPPRRRPAPRRWPLVLLLAGTALAAGGVAVWKLPPGPPARATVRPAPPMVAATPAPEPWPAPPASDPTLDGGVEAPRRVAAFDAPLPGAEPPREAQAGAPLPGVEPPREAQADDARPSTAEPSQEAEVDAPAPALVPETAGPVAVAAAAAPGPAAVPDAPRLSDPVLAAALMRRAEAALARGDIATARAFFVRAVSVDPWSVEAMVGAGKTYDPGFLHPLGATGGLADPAEARRWYDRASQLGDPTATGLAERLGDAR